MAVTDFPRASVVLISAPGLARDRLRQAIVNAGGHLVLEQDGEAVDVSLLAAMLPSAIVMALDDNDSPAIDALLDALTDAGLPLLLEEAAVAAARDGWDAQRWERHLAAKLHGHGNVHPAGVGEDVVEFNGLELIQTIETASSFDVSTPLLDPVLTATLIDEPAVAVGTGEWSSADTALLDRVSDWSALDDGDESLDWTPPVLDPASTIIGLDDLLVLGLPDEEPGSPAAVVALESSHTPVVAHSALELLASDAVLPAAIPPPLPTTADPHPVTALSPSSWALIGDDEHMAVASPAAAAPAVAPREWKLEGLSLTPLDGDVEPPPVGQMQAAATSVVPGPRGVGILMAGIGGPDAVRRVLGMLPETGVAGAILVRLQLDGGRYANLVSQLSRACRVPVLLAQANEVLGAGNVYILDENTSVSRAGGVWRFIPLRDGGSVLDDLPAVSTGVVMLSGADPRYVPAAIALHQQGAWVAGQSGEGCYDPAAASALAVEDLPIGEPAWLAAGLLTLWQ